MARLTCSDPASHGVEEEAGKKEAPQRGWDRTERALGSRRVLSIEECHLPSQSRASCPRPSPLAPPFLRIPCLLGN